jgi:hypothetical protein
MGQKVNPHFYKFGISNFWSSINYPVDKKKSAYIEFNYILNLLIYFFKIYNIEIYFFKAYLNQLLNIYVYVYINFYPKKFKKKLKKINYFKKC